METNRIDQRRQFVGDAQSGAWLMTELCERYGISRPTGYKWLTRAAETGELDDRSRRPQHCPHQTPAALEALIVAARQELGWGAKKLLRVLRTRHPDLAWPARSTVNAVLARHDLLRRRRRRTPWPHPGPGPLGTSRPNQIWPADFKGHFKTGDRRYCYPLTITDHFSRSLLECRALSSTRTAEALPVFRQLFRSVGLPEIIRTDNGSPFASVGIHGLSRLNVWWMQLGIVHQRIHPASPQENGTHERMHRELKAETARPPAANRAAQQARFRRFQQRYNEVRPHEGIADRVPASLWVPSPRPFPERIWPPLYPAHFEVRRVSSCGTFRWHQATPFLSNALRGQQIGLDEIDNGVWNIVYYTTLLGRLDVRTMRITGFTANPRTV